MRKIKGLRAGRVANPGKPHMPQLVIAKDREFETDGVKCTDEMFDVAIELGYAEELEVINKTPEQPDLDFDPRAASYDELVKFVEKDPELLELVDVRQDEEALRQEIVDLLEGE